MRLVFFLVSCCIAAQSFAASIWHVQGDREYYLFGTIHILKPDSYPLPPVYDSTLANCDVLWLEADSAELADANVLQSIQQSMLLPAGQTLRDQVSKDAYAQLELLADKAQVSLDLLQGLKPWAAANQLTLYIFQQAGFTGDGLDMYLESVARKRGVPVKAFETFLWQLNMFDELSNQVGDDFIEFSTADMENVDQLVGDLYQHWTQGDYAKMYVQAGFDDYPEVEAAMLTNRNNKWMKTLLKTPKNEVQCVAVGALHMAAEHGLIAQFERAGYRVTQVK